MADQEVIKHTKKIYNIWSSKEHGFWHKAKEFVLEVLIIVFAVSLSIWLHGRSEHSHQQAEVKEFLLGLKSDLQNDIEEMRQDRKMFEKSSAAFNYLCSVGYGQEINSDSLRKYDPYLFNETGLLSNNGRFEGFKSSGKIGTIENQELQNTITDLYQEDVPFLVLNTGYYNSIKSKLKDYSYQHVKRTGAGSNNLKEVLQSEVAYNLAQDMTNVRSIVSQYDKCIGKIDKIVKIIDRDYK
jgi:hypothetical protein